MGSSYDTKLAKVYNSTAQKNDMEAVLRPHMNWHSMLTAAPVSVAILGNILLIAGKKDFSLENVKPDTGFKHIRYSNSFRATLMQLVNESHDAMYESHTKMDQIRLYTMSVPNFLKSAVQILAQGTTKQVEVMLPTHLKKIQETAVNCKALAFEVEKKYINVTYLISEILEAAIASDGQYKIRLEENEARRSVEKLEEERLKKEQENDLREVRKMEQESKENQDELKKAFVEQPTGWELIGMGFVETLGQGLSLGLANLGQGLGTCMNPSGALVAQGGKAGGNLVQGLTEIQNSSIKQKDQELDIKGLKNIQKLQAFASALSSFQNSEGLSNEAIMSKKTGALAIKASIESLMDRMDPAYQSQSTVLELGGKAVSITKDLLDLANNLSNNPDKSKDVIENIQEFLGLMTEKKMYADAKLNTSSMAAPGPRQQVAQHQSGGAKSAVQSVVEQSRHKIETYKGLLQVAQDRYDKAVQQQRETNREFTETLKRLETLRIEKLDFEEIKAILKGAITNLANLKEQWTRLAQFFSFIANIIKVTLSQNLESFKSVADDQRKLVLDGVTFDDLMRDQIYAQAMQSNIFAHFVNHIATSYCAISQDHIMPQVSRLGFLSSLDPEQDAAQIQQEQQRLTSDSTKAQEAIAKLVSEDQKTFRSDMEQRRATVDSELGSLLAPASPATLDAVTSAVKSIKNEEENIQFNSFDANSFV